jgi:uncharacterized membrane protein YagU involved in acid resistance
MPKKLNERAVLLAGLVAGTIDICGAILVYTFILRVITVQQVLQSVASGVFGKQAYSGGNGTALAGLLFHFCIAMLFAFIYALIYPVFNKIIRSTFIKGILYGCAVWCIMNLIVVPHSNINRPFTFDWKNFLTGIGLIIFCVGIPIAYVVKKLGIRD